MSLCYVTAFLDIGRNNWKNFSRNVDEYLKAFERFIELFQKFKENDKLVMLCFIDERYFDRIRSLNPSSNMIFIKIDEKYLEDNSVLWSRLKREEEIMNSEKYKNLVSHRLQFPENSFPKYTMINHCKIDFVNLAIKQVKTEYYCWVDFGYLSRTENVPYYTIDVNKLNKEKINYTLINDLEDKDKDYLYTLKNAPEKIGGFFFFGNLEILKKYQELYHAIHLKFQNLSITDDDQFMALQCYFENPSIFQLHKFNFQSNWHKALIQFQKDSLTTIMNRNGSDKGSGHHNYTFYYEKLFGHLRESKIKILEIGIGSNNPNIPSNMSGTPGGYKPGASLRGWKEYFENGLVYGCDIDKNILFTEERISTFFLNQTDKQSLKEQISDVDRVYDLIVDDGLHYFSVNWFVTKEIISKLSQDGFYIIEDIFDFNKNIFDEPFSKEYDIKYLKIPNEKNTADNNILVIRNKGRKIVDI